MSDTKPFTDPVSDIEEKHRKRTSIIFDLRVVGVLKKIHCRASTEQTTANLLLAKLADELTRAGYEPYSPDEYEHAVLNCRIVLSDASKRPRKRSPAAGATAGS